MPMLFMKVDLSASCLCVVSVSGMCDTYVCVHICPYGREILFVGRFLITDSIALLVIQFGFCVSS